MTATGASTYHLGLAVLTLTLLSTLLRSTHAQPPSPAPSSAPFDATADPVCLRGVCGAAFCCPAFCGDTCGTAICATQPASPCCRAFVSSTSRSCNAVGAPCRVSGHRCGSLAPGVQNVWDNVDDQLEGRPKARHEACFVMAFGKGYLIGGRGRNKNVGIFNPLTRTWTTGPDMPTEMHHMQCVHFRGAIYVASSWFQGSPNDMPNERMWIYHVANSSWTDREGLPQERRRGGAAAVLFKRKIFIVGGNIGGHGPHSNTTGLMDYYDLITKEWVTNLPELPEGRDHVGGAVVKGRICIAGGRDGGAVNSFAATISSTYCYNHRRRRWTNMNAPIPTRRAGAATGRTCDGKMMVVGGEGPPKRVFNDVEVFNGTGWEVLPPLVRARHGTGLAIAKCRKCGHIFIAAGSGFRGGRPELNSTERYVPVGAMEYCQAY